jgi:uncharacterized membrane protein YoaK (UPF0700 family)
MKSYGIRTEHNPIVESFEQYQLAIKLEKKQEIKRRRAARRTRLIIRCAAWLCIFLAIISSVFTQNYLTTAIDVSLFLVCFALLKFKILGAIL